MLSAISNAWNRVTTTVKEYAAPVTLIGLGAFASFAASRAARAAAGLAYRAGGTWTAGQLTLSRLVAHEADSKLGAVVVLSVAALAFTVLGMAFHSNRIRSKVSLEKDTQIQEKNQTIRNQAVDIAEKDKVINELEQENKNLKNQVSNAPLQKIASEFENGKLSDRNDQITINVIAEKDQKIQELQNDVSSLAEDNLALRSRVDQLSQQLEETDKALDGMIEECTQDKEKIISTVQKLEEQNTIEPQNNQLSNKIQE